MGVPLWLFYGLYQAHTTAANLFSISDGLAPLTPGQYHGPLVPCHLPWLLQAPWPQHLHRDHSPYLQDSAATVTSCTWDAGVSTGWLQPESCPLHHAPFMHLYGYASLWHKPLVPLTSLTHFWVSPSPVALALLGAPLS